MHCDSAQISCFYFVADTDNRDGLQKLSGRRENAEDQTVSVSSSALRISSGTAVMRLLIVTFGTGPATVEPASAFLSSCGRLCVIRRSGTVRMLYNRPVLCEIIQCRCRTFSLYGVASDCRTVRLAVLSEFRMQRRLNTLLSAVFSLLSVLPGLTLLLGLTLPGMSYLTWSSKMLC